MALSDITPFDKRPLEQKLQSLGYTLYDDGENAPRWISPDGSRLRFDDNGDPILNGGEMQLLQNYNAELAAQGYAKNDYIQNNGGLTQDQAMQVIYGPGSVRVDEPGFGSLIKAGLPADQWNLPDMEGFGNGFLDNFADSGGPIKLLAGGLTAGLASALTPTLTSVGANAAIGGGLSAITGGDPLAGLVSGGLGAGLPAVGITDPGVVGAIKGAAGGLIAGGDPLMSAVTGAAGGYANSVLSDLTRNAMTFSASDGTAGDGQYDVTVEPAGGMLDYMDSLGADPWGTTQETYNNIPMTGGTNLSFFTDILGDPNAPDNFDLVGDPSALGLDPYNWGDYLPTDGTGPTGDVGTVFGEPGFDMSPYIGSDWGDLAKAGGATLAKFLLGGGSTSDQIRRLLGGTAKGQDGGILGDIFGNRGLVGTGLALTPTLAAINYAKNTEPIDTSALEALTGSVPGNFTLDTSGLRDVMNGVPASFSVDTSPLKGLQSQVPVSFGFDTAGLRGVANQIPSNFNVDTSRLSGINVPTSFNFDTSALNGVMNQVPTSYNFDTSKINDVYNRIPTNQTFDTSRLTAAYDAFDPNSVTGQYDLNTAAARQGLTSSLAARGVAGSSFANSDFANFNQARDVGRQSLINDAITRRAGIANDILANDRATAGLNLQGLGMQGQLANNLVDQQRSQAALGLQGLGLRGQLAGQLLDNQRAEASLGLQGKSLEADVAGRLINAQQTANAQNLQGLGLRGNLEQGLLDNQRAQAALGLQGQGLRAQIGRDLINADQTANAQTLQGLGLRGQMAQGILDSDYRAGSLGLQAQGLKRGILGDILGARIQQQKNKNDLYGRALLALSGGLSSRASPLWA